MGAIRHILALTVCALVCTASHAVKMRSVPGSGAYALSAERDNPVLWQQPDASPRTKAVAPGGYANRDIPRTGQHEYLVILVEFSDRHFSITDKNQLLSTYESFFNGRGRTDNARHIYKDEYVYYGATGSVSEYFIDQSFGKYEPSFRIIGPIRVSKGYAHYGANRLLSEDIGIKELVREVYDSVVARGDVNLDLYATNGNIDQFPFIYAGRGENYPNSDASTLYPQADTLRNWRGRNISFACTCELFWDSNDILDGIGTFCHEFSHLLGLPDFYNVSSLSDSNNNAAMGFWSLMDYGNYENLGFSPVGYTAFERYCMGWMDIEEITAPGHYVLDDISLEPDPAAGIHTAYRINTGREDDFIILENHIRTGWYNYHASEGLMVTAVSYDHNAWVSNTVNSNSSYKRYRILPADNTYDRFSNAGDLYPNLTTDSITPKGLPKLQAGSSIPEYSIYRIRMSGNKMLFYVGHDAASKLTSPAADEIAVSLINGAVEVNAPVGSRVSIHDLSGKPVIETATMKPVQYFDLPGAGFWIVRCGEVTRKLKNEN